MGIPFLRVIHPGPLSTVQDLGRFGYLKFGLPPSGAADEFSFRIGNALLGNPPEAACLELTVGGGKYQVLEDSIVAITGADMGPKMNGSPAKNWETIILKKGDILEFSLVTLGCRSYLCVSGGIEVPPVLGSKSTYLLANLGGIDGRPLKEGDVLFRGEGKSFAPRFLPEELIPQYLSPFELRAIPGPQEDHFLEEGMSTFFQGEFVVSPQSNRMGYRLEGPKIETLKKGIVSDAVPLGAVQVSGDGNPIILLWDRQTTGGYPKIAVVIKPDIWKIAQSKPGDKIRFRMVGMEEAISIYREYVSNLRWMENLLK